MILAATIAVALVGLLHVYVMVLESFLWETPYGRRVFGTTPETAAVSKTLAQNQGVYNLFLAAGLLWSVWLGVADVGRPIAMFFLGCVTVAGIVGGVTAARKILYVQAIPALIALLLVLMLK